MGVMASKEHMKKQLSTEEQLARYNARTPEEQERRRLARRARRNASKLRRAKKKGLHLKSKEDKLKSFLENTRNALPALDQDSFVCIDLEQFEWQQHKLTEVGITTYDHASMRVRTRHLVIKENYKKRNKKFVCDNKDNFQFGDSEMVSLGQAKHELREVLKSGPCVVGHAIAGDLNWISKYLKIPTNKCTSIDTNVLNKVIIGTKDSINLGKCCEQNNLDHRAPHNAGNDSHVNMYLFLAQRGLLRDLREVQQKRLLRKAA